MTGTGPEPPRFAPPVVAVAAFVAAYLVAAAIAAAVTANLEFVLYVAVMAALIGVVLVLHLRLGLPATVLAALALWGAMHMAGGLVGVPGSWPIEGDVRVLYSWRIVPVPLWGWIKYDHVVHAWGYGVTAWLVWTCLARWLQRRGVPARPSAGLMVVVVAAACGFGALNEIVEFLATRLTDTNVGGYVNTGLDLIANMVGATVAAGLIAWRGSRPGRP